MAVTKNKGEIDMTISLGKKVRLESPVVNAFDQLNFDFKKLKHELKDAIVRQASIYLDKKTNLAFIYLKVENLDQYEDAARRNQTKWWSHLEPIEVPEDESSFEYAWEDVFNIHDQDENE